MTEITQTQREAHQAVYREVFVQSECPRLVIALMYEDNELAGLSPINERTYRGGDNIFEAMGLEYHKDNAPEVAKEVIKVMIQSTSYELDNNEDTIEGDGWHWPQFVGQLEDNGDEEALELAERAENGELVL